MRSRWSQSGGAGAISIFSGRPQTRCRIAIDMGHHPAAVPRSPKVQSPQSASETLRFHSNLTQLTPAVGQRNRYCVANCVMKIAKCPARAQAKAHALYAETVPISYHHTCQSRCKHGFGANKSSSNLTNCHYIRLPKQPPTGFNPKICTNVHAPT